MVLAIDIGNTNIVIGCFEGDEILFVERVSTSLGATDLEYASIIRTAMQIHSLEPSDIDGAIISSVVPTLTATVQRAIEKYAHTSAMVVGPGIKTGLRILIDNPAQLGSDLVVSAVAAINSYSVPLIVVDMGTATTYSVIDRHKSYVGTLITAGIGISAEALASATSQLPHVAFDTPSRVIGKNTQESMNSGIMYANAAAIDGICSRIEAELGEKCSVIATGGLAWIVSSLCEREVILDDALTLKGLMLIYNKNKSN